MICVFLSIQIDCFQLKPKTINLIINIIRDKNVPGYFSYILGNIYCASCFIFNSIGH